MIDTLEKLEETLRETRNTLDNIDFAGIIEETQNITDDAEYSSDKHINKLDDAICQVKIDVIDTLNEVNSLIELNRTAK